MITAEDIPVDQVIPHALNPRDDMGDMDELILHTASHGTVQPILVFAHPKQHGQYVLLDGERRWRAARDAGADTIPAVIRPVPRTTAETLLVMLGLDFHRKPLTPVEKAQALGRLRDDCGMKPAQIAEQLGLASSTVSYHLSLLLLDEESQQRVSDKQVSAAAAHQAVGRAKVRARAQGKPPPARGKISVKPPHLAWNHVLASDVADRCGLRHLDRPKVGPGCGQCWEVTIRIDAGENEAEATAYVESAAAGRQALSNGGRP